MIVYQRRIQNEIESALFKGKTIVIYGARKVGKTTLIKQIIRQYQDETLYLDCDEPGERDALTGGITADLRLRLSNKTMVVIDEAQRVRNIGTTLKMLADNYPQIQVIAAGSLLLFDLSRNINEPLTGGKKRFYLYPIAVSEMLSQKSVPEMQGLLENRLRYGMYPGVVDSDDPVVVISEIVKNNLYRDLMEYQIVRNPDMIRRLLQVLALQIGGEISYNEIGKSLGIDKITVARYVSLLEQAYIIFQLRPYRRKLPKELGKLRKIYFYDLGVRNALINNFNPLNLRQDVEDIWENFFISERLKHNRNWRRYGSSYFWRTYSGTKLDYLEEDGGNLTVFDCNWRQKKWQVPPSFAGAYPNARFHQVNQQSYLDHLTLTFPVE